MISINARSLRTLHVVTLLRGDLVIDLCEELKALAGNKVLQVLKFTLIMRFYESEDVVGNTFRKLEEMLMDPGWSALVCVSIDIVVSDYECVGLDFELSSVPEMYLGRLSSRKILSYKWSNTSPLPCGYYFVGQHWQLVIRDSIL